MENSIHKTTCHFLRRLQTKKCRLLHQSRKRSNTTAFLEGGFRKGLGETKLYKGSAFAISLSLSLTKPHRETARDRIVVNGGQRRRSSDDVLAVAEQEENDKTHFQKRRRRLGPTRRSRLPAL